MKDFIKIISIPLVIFILTFVSVRFLVQDISEHLNQPVTIEKLEHDIVCVTKPVLWGYQKDCFKGGKDE